MRLEFVLAVDVDETSWSRLHDTTGEPTIATDMAWFVHTLITNHPDVLSAVSDVQVSRVSVAEPAPTHHL